MSEKDKYHFSTPLYFRMLDDGSLVEIQGPLPPVEETTFTVTAIDRATGTVTVRRTP